MKDKINQVKKEPLLETKLSIKVEIDGEKNSVHVYSTKYLNQRRAHKGRQKWILVDKYETDEEAKIQTKTQKWY